MANPAVVAPIERGPKFETTKTRVRSGTLPSGITFKMDAFARHVAEGMSLADAYRAAFNTANMKARAVSNDASHLARHPGVTAAVASYRAEFSIQNRMFALQRDERIWERLWGLIESENAPPAVKVKALDLAARLAGMLNDPRANVGLSAKQLEAELMHRINQIPE